MKVVAEMSKISEQVLNAILLIPVQFRSYQEFAVNSITTLELLISLFTFVVFIVRLLLSDDETE